MNTREHMLVVIALLCLWSTGVMASYYTGSLPVEVTQQFVARGPYSRITLAARMDLEQDVLTFLRVTLDGEHVSVPSKELADVRSPNLASIRLLYDGEDERNVFVRVECGDKDKVYAIQFHLTGDEYVDRMVLDDLP